MYVQFADATTPMIKYEDKATFNTDIKMHCWWINDDDEKQRCNKLGEF